MTTINEIAPEVYRLSIYVPEFNLQFNHLMDYMPYTPNTKRQLQELAALKPRTLAAMHGSAFVGDGGRALRDLAVVMREVYGERDDKH